MTGPYLLAIVIGGILSLLVKPVYDRLLKRGLGPKKSSGVTVLALLLLVIVPVGAFAVATVNQGILFGQKIAQSQDFSARSILGRISEWAPVKGLVGNAEAVERQIRNGVQTLAREASTAALAMLGAIPDQILQIVLALLACFFFLVDGMSLKRWMAGKIPLDRDIQIKLYKTFEDTAISVIWATLAAAGAQATVMGIAFLILGVPLPFLAAGATFIFAWIPLLGSTPVWLAGSIYLYTQGSIAKMVAMFAFGAVVGILDNFIRPMVLKGRSDLHPLVSLVAIFGGIQLFGFFGVFLGPIIIALLIGVLQVWPDVAKRYDLIGDEEAVPPPALPSGLTRSVATEAAEQGRRSQPEISPKPGERERKS